MSQQTLLNQIAELTECQLAPIVQEIDRKGIYPEQFMLNWFGFDRTNFSDS